NDINEPKKDSSANSDDSNSDIYDDFYNKQQQNIISSYEQFFTYKNIILENLKEYRSMLCLTQKNPEANFFDDDIAPEGSDIYKAMTTSLKNAIDTLSDKNSSIANMTQALNDLWSNSYDYFRAREGFFGPRTDNGKARLSIAAEIRDRTRLFKSQLEKNAPTHSLNMEQDNINVPLMNDSSLETNYNNYIAQSNINKGSAAYKTIVDQSQKKSETRMYALERTVFLNRLEKINDIDRNNPATFDPYNNADSVKNKAINYLTKKYITMLESKDHSLDNIRTLNTLLMPNEFKKEVNRLVASPDFKKIASNSPDSYYEDWKKVEENAALIVKEQKNVLSKYGPNPINYVDKLIDNDEKATAIADILIADLLTDPKKVDLTTNLAKNNDQLNSFKTNTVNTVKDYIKFITTHRNIDGPAREDIKYMINKADFKNEVFTRVSELEKAQASERNANSNSHIVENANPNRRSLKGADKSAKKQIDSIKL
ncbi:MAG: hypothetical protein K5656_03810, partial [Lachnospiraceae bacterium]|nr:hypothetical protein [Lachnospiraceae bacterium]